MTDRARSAAERVADTVARLEGDHDLWIATAHESRVWLIPLSFHWTGEVILMATVRDSPTFSNLAGGGSARISLGHTRDVIMVDGDVDLPDALPEDQADETAAAAGYDPRQEPETAYLRVVPRRVQAWRNAEELRGRTIMRAGRWVTSASAHTGDDGAAR